MRPAYRSLPLLTLVAAAVLPAVFACAKERVDRPPAPVRPEGAPAADAETPEPAPPPRADAAAVDAAPDAAPPKKLTAAECERLFDGARRELAAARSKTVNRCERNEDCMLGNDTPCLPSAGSAKTYGLPKTSVLSETQRESIVQKCRDWETGGCFSTTPRPITTQRPYWALCERGKCVASTSPPQ